jgi:hypothetical protein
MFGMAQAKEFGRCSGDIVAKTCINLRALASSQEEFQRETLYGINRIIGHD